MNQSISNQFRAALTHLLAKEGRGSQTRLANEQEIDRGYLNAIVKGRKSGSENIRAKIAAHFHMAYEDMFILGRRILEGVDEESLDNDNEVGLSITDSFQSFEPAEKVIDLKPSRKNEKTSSHISDKIVKVIDILESGTGYGDRLADLIDAFHDAIGTKEENLALKNQLRGLESRIGSLEKRLEDEKEYTEKSA